MFGDRIIAKIEVPSCKLIKNKFGNYIVKTAVTFSHYSRQERKIAFRHFRNEMHWMHNQCPSNPNSPTTN